MTTQPALRARTIRVRSSVIILLLALIVSIVVTVLSQRDSDPMFSTEQLSGVVSAQHGPGPGQPSSRPIRLTTSS